MPTQILSPILIALIVVTLALLAWIIVLQVRLVRIERRYRRMMGEQDHDNLEQMLNQHLGAVRGTVSQVSELQAKTRQLERTLKNAIQHMGLVRFNPFRDTGGNQSFTWAISDGHGDGIVVSSLHSREGTRIYAKPLTGWESPYPLTDEEKQAVERANQQPS